jgi:hypothetical protein
MSLDIRCACTSSESFRFVLNQKLANQRLAHGGSLLGTRVLRE